MKEGKGVMKSVSKVVVMIAVAVLVGWVISQWTTETDQSVSLSEIPRGGDFSLDAANGQFDLKAQRGKVVLIYFGYTFCPDVCPTNLMLMAQALNAMNTAELTKVQGVFISVDPERDTLDRLATYTNHFHTSIAGITGKPDYIARIAQQYGAAYRKVEGESRGGYLVDHSSNTYVIAPDGSLHTILPHATPPEGILEVTRKLLAQTQSNN